MNSTSSNKFIVRFTAYIKSFVLAFQFLTRLPLKFSLSLDDSSYARAQCFYPFVGALVGVLSALVYYLFSLAGLLILPAAACVIFGYAITGAFHLDGIADFSDAFFANKDSGKTLEILKDTRMGVYGVLSIVICFALKTILLTEHFSGNILFLIICAPVCSKIAVAVCSFGKYAREEGVSKNMLEYNRAVYPIISLTLAVIFAFVLFGLHGIISSLIIALFGLLLLIWSNKKIGGVTGDVMGAASEAGEILFYLSILLFERIHIF